MLKEGDSAPAFRLPVDSGDTLDSSTLVGKPYVLYFYPRDNTPGCTAEACDFRDQFERIAALGATVIGVSRDSVASHQRFKQKHALPFYLVSDADRTLQQAYGAWGLKKMYGKELEGTIRSTFLIGADGIIARAWPKVRVKGHVAEVVEAVSRI